MELSRFRSLLALSLTFALAGAVAGCGEPAADPSVEEGTPDPESENDIEVDPASPEATTILEFLNDGSTTVEVLDVQVALDARAAENLVAHRDGLDATGGTSDDDAFDSMEEVDLVSWVGPAALEKLTAYVAEQGWLYQAGGNYEGVVFNTAQVTLTLDLVNFASLETLDDEIQLDSRAAENIVAARPIASMTKLAALGYVGPSALERLRGYLPTWQEQGITLEVYDGVTFTHEEAAGALAAANQATREALIEIGISGAQDDLILEGRPWTSLSLVTATGGVGPLTTLRLKLLSDKYSAALYVVNASDAAQFAEMTSFGLRDDEVFGGEIFALLADVTADEVWMDSRLSDLHDAIGARVTTFATTEIGREYSSRDAAFFSVWTYGRGLLDTAKMQYPEGILEFLPRVTNDAKLARGKKGILSYWENTFVHTEQWIDVFEGRTWDQVKDQVVPQVMNFENNGEYYEVMEGYPDANATAFIGRVYGLHTEVGVDHVGKVVIVYVEID